MINIDILDKKINERFKNIKHLRRQSIELLRELPSVDFKNDSGYKATGFLEIENEISRLQNENTDLENKRDYEISKLHSSILGGNMGSGTGKQKLFYVKPHFPQVARSPKNELNKQLSMTSIVEPSESNILSSSDESRDLESRIREIMEL